MRTWLLLMGIWTTLAGATLLLARSPLVARPQEEVQPPAATQPAATQPDFVDEAAGVAEPSLNRPLRPAAREGEALPPPEALESPARERPSGVTSADLAAREQLVSGLVGSAHDFTHGDRSGRDLCLPCHTPHLLAATPPAWDARTDTPMPLRPYRGPDAELNSWSLLCLGCHDGVTAIDIYSSGHAVTIAAQLGNSRLGTRGLRSHPMGIPYPQGRPDYHPLAAVEAAGLPLPDGRIQCTTCHNAHNTHQIPGLLQIPNERSRLCLTCHRL